jgi:hypothetical protein
MPLLNEDAIADLRSRQMEEARSERSARTWLNRYRAASEVLMPGPRAKYYTLATEAALNRVIQGLQTIWSDPDTIIGDKIAIMREIHERMAATLLGQGELAPGPLPEPRPQKPKRREDPPRI